MLGWPMPSRDMASSTMRSLCSGFSANFNTQSRPLASQSLTSKAHRRRALAEPLDDLETLVEQVIAAAGFERLDVRGGHLAGVPVFLDHVEQLDEVVDGWRALGGVDGRRERDHLSEVGVDAVGNRAGVETAD